MSTRETYDFAKMLKHARLAQAYGDSLRREKAVKGTIKDTLGRMINRFKAAENEVLGAIPKASRDILETQLLHLEVSGQIEGMLDMILELPQHSRDTIEQYIASVHKLNRVQL